MLSPKELYYWYTTEPCEDGGRVFGQNEGYIGKGTPYDLPRLSNFLKQVKYPCYQKAPYSAVTSSSDPSGILDTGKDQLALPYKFLTRLDLEAFKEIQPTINSGTSHAIRNACDVMRACSLELTKRYDLWENRTATEYMQYFASYNDVGIMSHDGNHVVKCLMALGPDLVPSGIALKRGTGCGDMNCLPSSNKYGSSALGASFGCQEKETGNGKECTSCEKCEKDPKTGKAISGSEECCSAATCEDKVNFCCGDITGDRSVWLFKESSSDVSDNSPPISYPIKHIGILKRKSYGGYVNLINNSGPNMYACPGELLLKYFQQRNNYNYETNAYSKTPDTTTNIIDRVRTISMVIDPTLNSIKDLIYNGYGVVLMTNVGFPNSRDSTGLSYPDRIWYHTYPIIAYDDRKIDYNECVFLLANSWGKWNDGGHPKWGPIPEGSFLVTETHLRCMTNLFRTDKRGCRKKTSIIPDPLNPDDPACDEDTPCSPYECGKNQKAMGMVFALSLNDGFPRQILDYSQFYKEKENQTETNFIAYLDNS